MKDLVYCMELICNIQAMKERIDEDYSSIKDFNRLHRLGESALEAERDSLIPLYNATFKQNEESNH